MECQSDPGGDAPDVDLEDFEVVAVSMSISDGAVSRLRAFINEEPGDPVLCITIDRGGCSGLLYDMEIIERPGGDGFQHLEIEGIPVSLTDRDSSWLDGVLVSFNESLMGGGFKIENPNANRNCGCGKSFS